MMNDVDLNRIVQLVMKAYHNSYNHYNQGTPTSDVVELYVRRALMEEFGSTKNGTKTLLQG